MPAHTSGQREIYNNVSIKFLTHPPTSPFITYTILMMLRTTISEEGNKKPQNKSTSICLSYSKPWSSGFAHCTSLLASPSRSASAKQAGGSSHLLPPNQAVMTQSNGALHRHTWADRGEDQPGGLPMGVGWGGRGPS